MIGLLTPYLAWLKLAALVVACAFAYYQGGVRVERNCLASTIAAQAAAGKALQAEIERGLEIDAALQVELRRPRAGKAVREAVRANPSECQVNPDVMAAIRAAIRAVNGSVSP